MLGELAERYDVVGETFAEASEVLGYDLAALIRDNPDDKLNQTEYTQPAMLAAGVAVWRLWRRHTAPEPRLLAGHSLGEYSALVAGGALDFAGAVDLVRERARLMQAAVPGGQGAMAAILGLDDDQVIALCGEAAGDQVVEAVNFNSPGQVVIAGHREAVDRAVDKAEQAGARRAMILPVSVPAHSSLMRPAADRLFERIGQVSIDAPNIPVLHNVDAGARAAAGDIAEALKRQLHNPVRWVDTVNAMSAEGVDTVIEFGPGKVLAGLCRRIDKRLTVAAVDSPAGLDKALETAGAQQ
jgi:[acyl-carrier-protein] S-malonyltransferase